MVTELHIINKDSNLFTGAHYFVPLYQRGYAWEDKHINQLIDDIMDIPCHEQYFIGSLIVHRRDNAFEVIDGQQRLTTIFLLLQFLEVIKNEESTALRFDCRDKSNYTLTHIGTIVSDISTDLIDNNQIQQELVTGYKIIKDKLTSIDHPLLKEKLSRTVIYRIEVPEHTDLNHYFEIMNTRGEQLEQSDVLKAKLMGHLQGNRMCQATFATIWDACRNMDGYVQMHFSKAVRDEFFQPSWNEIPCKKLNEYTSVSNSNNQDKGYSIMEAIKEAFKVEADNGENNEKQKARFESIIDFPYFLLHTLRVFVHSKNITSTTPLLDRMLDDKKLVEAFDRVLTHGRINDREIDSASFVKEFGIFMLRTRFLFDKYIIKREFIGDMVQDGEWSLKEMYSSCQRGNKKATYRLTKVVDYYQHYNTECNKEILMLQAAMRVSYTSPKVMHWITDLLVWLTDYFMDRVNNEWIYKEKVNSIARKPVIEFLSDERNLYLGVATSHMVLNYLDYLLWRENKDEDFDFEFRNSVEHWYPRNPSEGSFPRWDDDKAEGVNRFGNLCLIQRNVNSKFSNMHPSAKKSTFQEMISNGSLKLRIMSKITAEDSKLWRDETCSKHETEMINLLKRDCEL